MIEAVREGRENDGTEGQGKRAMKRYGRIDQEERLREGIWKGKCIERERESKRRVRLEKGRE